MDMDMHSYGDIAIGLSVRTPSVMDGVARARTTSFTPLTPLPLRTEEKMRRGFAFVGDGDGQYPCRVWCAA